MTGGPLLVILAQIHILRSENGVVRPLNPRFVDDIYTKCNESVEDILFHTNISLSIEENTKEFLDTKTVLHRYGTVTTFIYRKETKIAISWISKSHKCYKRNTILGNLNRLKRILSNFDIEIRAIKKIILTHVTLY